MTSQDRNKDKDMDREGSTGRHEGREGSTDTGADDRSGWRGVTDQGSTGQGSMGQGSMGQGSTDEGVMGGESWNDPSRQNRPEDEDTSGMAEETRRDDLSRS